MNQFLLIYICVWAAKLVSELLIKNHLYYSLFPSAATCLLTFEYDCTFPALQALAPVVHPHLTPSHLHAAWPHLVAGCFYLAAHLVLRGVSVTDG